MPRAVAIGKFSPMSTSQTKRAFELGSRYLKTAASCAALFTLGALRPEGRERIGRISKLLGFAPADLPPAELPVVSIDELTEPSLPVVLRELDGVNGNVTLLELVALARLVRSRRPRVIFEIGTFDGRTTLNLAANSPDDARIYTLDLPASAESTTAFPLHVGDRQYVRKPASGERVHTSDLAHKVTQLLGDSGAFDFRPYSDAGGAGVDFVFVDGSHSYDYARSDSLNAIAMLRGGHGTIVWHDYNDWRGVSQALHELRRGDARFAGLRWISGTTLAVLDCRSPR